MRDKVSEAALFMIHTDTQYLSERLESVKDHDMFDMFSPLLC